MIQGIDPLKYYERRGKHSESLVVKTNGTGAFSTGNDQQVIAAVSGKRIRVLGWIACSNTTTAGWYQFEDGSAGSDLASVIYASPNNIGPDVIPIFDGGYFETSTGTGLYVDVGAAAVNLTVFYVEYTP